jgi:hypothetical protein
VRKVSNVVQGRIKWTIGDWNLGLGENRTFAINSRKRHPKDIWSSKTMSTCSHVGYKVPNWNEIRNGLIAISLSTYIVFLASSSTEKRSRRWRHKFWTKKKITNYKSPVWENSIDQIETKKWRPHVKTRRLHSNNSVGIKLVIINRWTNNVCLMNDAVFRC